MFDKILDIVLATKSGLISGAIIVAGALVTVSAGSAVTTVQVEPPAPTSSVHTPPPLELVLEDVEDTALPDDEFEDELEVDDEDDADGVKPVALRPDASCANGDAARAQARERVSAGLVKARAALDEARSRHRTTRALETLDKAEAMLREIAEKTDLVLAEMAECEASHVADRALDALETVVNLANSAASATPAPTEKPKATAKPATPKPTAKPTTKPARTPSCDDRLYENKAKMAAAFEKYHTLNDKLYAAIKRTASAKTVATVLANDKTMHATYDAAKNEILRAGCAGDLGAAAAARAASTFERAWQSSAAAAAGDRR